MISKKILIAAFALYGFNAMAQVKLGDNTASVNANSLLELESTNKGLLHPRVALTATTNAAPLSAHVQGMTVYNTATAGDVTPGVYVNDGSKWAPLKRTAGTSVTAACNGFTGSYLVGNYSRSYTVTFSNNSFSEAQVTPAIGDLVLNQASGLTVASVTPNTTTAIASGGTLTITYTLGGTLAGTPGTQITGTFTKLGLSCTSTVAIADTPVAVVSGPNGTTLTFMAHNLGADISLDPHIPVQGIHGNYYQWGRIAPVANATTPAGSIAGWNNTVAPENAWGETKTANDPCPEGYRVPTHAEWGSLYTNNTISRTGTWENSATNFGAAAHYGPDAATKIVTLPVAGGRLNTNGALFERGNIAMYWASTPISSSTSARIHYIHMNFVGWESYANNRRTGMPVRCIKQ